MKVGTLHEELTLPPVCMNIFVSEICYSGVEGSNLL